MEKRVFSNLVLEQLGVHHHKKRERESTHRPDLTSLIKINSTWIEYLHAKCKIIQLLEKSKQKNLCELIQW